jgi:thiamine-phosphate pyrophosphorylase
MLCLVTDRHRLAGRLGCDPSQALARLPELALQASAAGIDLIQIRERDLEAAELADLTRACLAALGESATRIVVNDRLDVALSTGAHGVHLRGDSFRIDRIARPSAGFLIGQSVRSPDEAAAAALAGANYLIFGTVLPSRSKPDATETAGLSQLRQVVARSRGTPVLAIGGMTVANARDVAATGAAGIAGIDLFLPSETGLTVVAARVRAAFRGAARAGGKPAAG